MPGAGRWRRCRVRDRFQAMPTFQEKLNEQIAHEFAASQQYIAIAVHYDAQTLPQLAAHFYRQSVEERNHAMMMVQYLLDADDDVVDPGRRRAADGVRRRRRARSRSRSTRRSASPRRSPQLAVTAREEGDLVAEQFMHWFLQEQREEVSSMSALLQVVERLAGQRDARRGLPRPRVRRRRTRSRPAHRLRRAARSSRRVVELRLQTERQSQLVDITRARARGRGRASRARQCSCTCRTRRRA